jgi:hypothetical protein
VKRRVVRPAAFWREVDLRIRSAIALDAQLGSAYEHSPTCACVTCETVAERLADVVERVEQEVRQQLACEVADDVGDA